MGSQLVFRFWVFSTNSGERTIHKIKLMKACNKTFCFWACMCALKILQTSTKITTDLGFFTNATIQKFRFFKKIKSVRNFFLEFWVNSYSVEHFRSTTYMRFIFLIKTWRKLFFKISLCLNDYFTTKSITSEIWKIFKENAATTHSTSAFNHFVHKLELQCVFWRNT